MAIDFEKEFTEFTQNNEGSAIRDIYNIIPSLNNQQIKIINTTMFYVKKYELNELREFIQEYLSNVKVNKNLGFMSSMNVRNLLKAYTQEKLITGIKVQSKSGEQEQ